jgi:hypothetical protein
MIARVVACGMFVATIALVSACGGEIAARRADGLDTSAMPEDIRADYQVFADRCSKCHSLSRPLGSGIDTDEYWQLYVERMRRQPGSGISKEDTVVILRFLHYLVLQQREKKNAGHQLLPIPLGTARKERM